jgi:hypothetical protein
MEREVYALWKGVTHMDRFTKGFLVYCYTDHKNNTFVESLLENRRRSKKLTGWALELAEYRIARVWIRGGANILGDAPSRAPWEVEVAKHLPVPNQSVKELIRMMYTTPEELEALYESRANEMGLGDTMQAIPRESRYEIDRTPDRDDSLSETRAELQTENKGVPLPKENGSIPEDPQSGARTPEFGVEPEILEGPSDLIASLGPGVGASDFAIRYPTFGAWYPDVSDIEKILPCTVTGYSRPLNARDLPRAVWHDK